MNIIQTNINDISIDKNLDIAKVNLANEIISFIKPILSKEYRDIAKEIKHLKKSLHEKKEKIKNEKLILENLLKDFYKKDKESQLLKRMGKLIQTGLIQESMKNEMVMLLRSFESISEEKITGYLNETMRIISNKFAKN